MEEKKKVGIKLWLYGKPFSGKSYFANQFPKPYCINTDGNARFYDVPHEVVKDYDSFVKALTKFDEKEYDTLIVDVADHIYDFVREYFLTKNGVDHESDLEWGKGWTLVREGAWTVFNKLAKLDCNVILISHEIDVEEKNSLGMTKTVFKPAMVDKLIPKLSGIMQLVGRVYRDDTVINGETITRHYVSFGSNSNELSGVRIPISELKIENTYEAFEDILR